MSAPLDLLPLTRCLGRPMPPRTAVELADAVAAAVLEAPGERHEGLSPAVISLGTDGRARLGVSSAVHIDYRPPPGMYAETWVIGALLYEALAGAAMGHLPEREILHDGAVERALSTLALSTPLHTTVRDLLRFRGAARLSLRAARASFQSLAPVLPGPPLTSWVTERVLSLRDGEPPVQAPPTTAQPPVFGPPSAASAAGQTPEGPVSTSAGRRMTTPVSEHAGDSQTSSQQAPRARPSSVGGSTGGPRAVRGALVLAVLGLGGLMFVVLFGGAAAVGLWWWLR